WQPPACLSECRRCLVTGDELQSAAVPPKDIAKCGVANANRFLQHGCKYPLDFFRRARDSLEHFRCGCLLLKRLREVYCAFGEVDRALTQLVEQPRILDGDDCLSREILTQLDLFLGEGLEFLTIHAERPDQLVLLQHWHHQNRPYSPKFDTRND